MISDIYDIILDILSDIKDLFFFFVNKNGFIIFHLNIRSITKKCSQQLVMLNNTVQFVNCIIFTECWLNNCAIKFDIDFIHYNLILFHIELRKIILTKIVGL